MKNEYLVIPANLYQVRVDGRCWKRNLKDWQGQGSSDKHLNSTLFELHIE